jgi:hypothetical protein
MSCALSNIDSVSPRPLNHCFKNSGPRDFFNSLSHEQKFGCREFLKTAAFCRDLPFEANASASGSRSGRLSVS